MQHGAPVAQYWPGRGQTARSAKARWWAGGRAATGRLLTCLAHLRAGWYGRMRLLLRRAYCGGAPPPAAPPSAGPVAEPWPSLRRPPASPRHTTGMPSPRLARGFIPPLGVAHRAPGWMPPAEGACMPGLHHRPWVSGADPDRYPVASGGAMAVRQSCRPVPTPPPPPSSPPRRAQRRRGRAARQWRSVTSQDLSLRRAAMPGPYTVNKSRARRRAW